MQDLEAATARRRQQRHGRGPARRDPHGAGDYEKAREDCLALQKLESTLRVGCVATSTAPRARRCAIALSRRCLPGMRRSTRSEGLVLTRLAEMALRKGDVSKPRSISERRTLNRSTTVPSRGYADFLLDRTPRRSHPLLVDWVEVDILVLRLPWRAALKAPKRANISKALRSDSTPQRCAATSCISRRRRAFSCCRV